MTKESEALKEVWAWKEEAYLEVKDLPTLEEKIKKRLENINSNVKEYIKSSKFSSDLHRFSRKDSES